MRAHTSSSSLRSDVRSRLPGLGSRDSDAPDLIGPLATDRAVEVVERAIVKNHRRLVREGLIDGAGSTRIDKHFRDLGEVSRVLAQSEQLASSSRLLIAETEVI